MPDEKWGVGPICPVHIEFRRAALSLYRWGSPKAQKELSMMESLVTAAVLSCGLTGYALAQATVTGAPEGTAPVTAEPVHHHHWHWHHHGITTIITCMRWPLRPRLLRRLRLRNNRGPEPLQVVVPIIASRAALPDNPEALLLSRRRPDGLIFYAAGRRAGADRRTPASRSDGEPLVEELAGVLWRKRRVCDRRRRQRPRGFILASSACPNEIRETDERKPLCLGQRRWRRPRIL
jgi:hypothetical protein